MGESEKINYPRFVLICVIAFGFYLSNQMVVNTVTKYADALSASTQMAGFIGGSYGVMSLITRPFAGQIVDNERHKPLLVGSMAFLVLSDVILLSAAVPVMVLLSRAVNGLAVGFASTVCMTTACEALPKSKLANGIGIFTLAQTLAQVIGPAIAIEIIDKGNFRRLYILTTAVMAAAFLLSLLFGTNHEPRGNRTYSFRLSEMFTLSALIPGSVLICNVMQIAAVSSFMLLYADSIGVGGLSYFFTIQALAILFTRPLVSRFLNERNQYFFMIASELLLIGGLLNLFWAKNKMDFLVSAALFGLGKSGAQPALVGMCLSCAPPDERGRASSTQYACQDIGQFAGSYIAGIVASFFGYRYAFMSIAVIVALGTTFFMIAYMAPRLRKNPKERSL